MLINSDDYLTPREAADALGLHVGTLANQRHAGRSPVRFVMLGRTVLYDKADVRRHASRDGRGT